MLYPDGNNTLTLKKDVLPLTPVIDKGPAVVFTNGMLLPVALSNAYYKSKS